MAHIEEHPHAFIKNGVVTDIAVFAEDAHGSELLETVKTDKGADTVVSLCDHGSVPHLYSTWDGTTFTAPTLDYLYSIGVSNENQAMHDARIAEEAAKAAENATPTA
jgi:hypothetical protein